MTSRSRRIGARLWCWSLWLTLPVSVGLLLWLAAFLPRFGDFRLRYDTTPHPFGFATDAWPEARAMLRALVLAVTGRRPEHAGLRVFELTLPEPELARLDADLPHSGFRSVDGLLRHAGGIVPVGLRYRGDYLYHWARAKKSWRVRLRGPGTVAGMRVFNLIAPKSTSQVNDALAYRLAAALGVMTPLAEPVVVYVNGSYRGLHLLVEQIQPITLHRHGRVPGDVFVGELVAKDAWQGVDNQLFDHPGLWARAFAEDGTPANDRSPLEQLCRLLALPVNEALHRELEQILDLEAFGRFGAAAVLLQSHHHDEIHNWRLYFDPARQRFEPILWDPNAWGNLPDGTGSGLSSLDPSPSRLQALLLTNARFLAARQATLHAFLGTAAAADYLREMDAMLAACRAVVPADPCLWPPDTDRVLAAMTRLRPHVTALFRTVADAMLQPRAPVLWDQDPDGVRVRIADRAGGDGLRLALAAPVPGDLAVELLRQDPTGERHDVVAFSAAADPPVITIPLRLHAQLEPAAVHQRGREVVATATVLPATYCFRLRSNTPATVTAVSVRRPDGTMADAARRPGLTGPPVDLLFGITGPAAETAHWEGDVLVQGVQHVHGDLEVAPATRVRMAAGAALIVHGRLRALGSRDAPIRFEAAQPGQAPWGTVALRGRGADGSVLHHCQFTGGGADWDRRGRTPQAAMLSVVDARDVVLADCRLAGGQTDAALLGAVYAHLRLTTCRFQDAAADGLALLHATAELDAVELVGCAGDAVRVIGGELVARGCRLQSCGGHGVTAIAGSRVLLVDIAMADCAVGVRAADAAEVTLAHATVTNTAVPLLANQIDLAFERGGSLLALCCRIDHHGAAIQAAVGASLQLRDCFVAALPQDANAQLVACDDREPERAALPPGLQGPRLTTLADAAARAWAAAPQGRRGALPR